MNTFSTEYMSTTPIGISSNIVRGIPRQVQIPVRKYKLSNKNKKTIQEIKKSLLTLTNLILKIN